jgi:hypothetical protein
MATGGQDELDLPRALGRTDKGGFMSPMLRT